jgi:hypothetical protein
MAFGIDKAFNKFAKAGNSLNKGINQIIGKDVIGEIKEMEQPREFPPYSSVPPYSVPEPEQWTVLQGTAKEFSLNENIISVSPELDACMQYRKFFKSSAEYYANQFEFKYHNCVQDFDSFTNYFSDLYLEGLNAMLKRAYEMLLSFGVFNANIDSFTSQHINNYQKAIKSYEIVVGVEESKNQAAENLGNQVGGAVQMQGGGFGFKGAMKGAAKAEAFNLGMGLVGKIVAHQGKMSQEEKANVFSKFNENAFFKEVYSDYFNTFLTFVQTLSNNRILNVTTIISGDYDTIFRNLKSPMFPQDKIAPELCKLISTNPFVSSVFALLQDKFGETDEVKQITTYFTA